MQQKSNTRLIIFIALSILIKLFSFFPAGIEHYYSTGIYPYISKFQRILLGWIPFSIGDIIYSLVFLLLVYKITQLTKAIFRKQLTRTLLMQMFKRTVYYFLVIYVLFNVLWGLNYNRLPMASQMGLQIDRYSTENLRKIVKSLVVKLNSFDHRERAVRFELRKKKMLFHEAAGTYHHVVQQYPSLAYSHTSVKPSLFSYLGNYMGFTGYYNPFSGEAQSNTTVPLFIQPFTTCHEIGHQIGYAKENEANFAGFLAGRASSNEAFRYSVYFDMYSYAIRELYRRDSLQVKALRAQLKPGVKSDLDEVRAFYRKYDNPLEPIIRALYGQYLKANEQPGGLRSYNEVVAMLVAYYLKNGEI